MTTGWPSDRAVAAVADEYLHMLERMVVLDAWEPAASSPAECAASSHAAPGRAVPFPGCALLARCLRLRLARAVAPRGAVCGASTVVAGPSLPCLYVLLCGDSCVRACGRELSTLDVSLSNGIR